MEVARFLSREGDRKPGAFRTISLGRPAAGTDWTVSVPGGVIWRIVLATAQLATSGAVANRTPRFHIGDGSVNLGSFEAAQNVAAGSTVVYTFVSGGIGLVQGVSGLFPVIGIPLIPLPSGYQINSITPNLQAGDQWSNVTLTVEEFYETAAAMSERAQGHERMDEMIEAALSAGGYPAASGPPLGR